ncbi:hypothetical protein STTU_4930 [Streptomyces sp. Tu6071]|uniref:hypothetical protein n=1 Tax=Streptomyces sp. Tu6071 TaxID=355249 RepID=UPI00020E6006|nr:hypothetical protein [Streptomyces sp. Tu6071]EGJ77719.1 hypothetical protein STTU_4930 [Streptomyces sp. Tu6071]
MSRAARILQALDLAAAVLLVVVALDYRTHGETLFAVLLAAAALLAVIAVLRAEALAEAHEHVDVLDDQLADARRREATHRESALRAWTSLGWVGLDGACCLRGWETRGADHDLTTCIHQEPTR